MPPARKSEGLLVSITPENLIPDILKPNTSNDKSDLGNMGKASFLELFFDLMLIVCMRRIVAVFLSGEGSSITPYEYYSFAFSFVLILQIWFSCTVLMNRSGRGDLKDARFLVVHMFLIFILTQAIGANWTSYIAFNVSWILLNLNLCWNWRRRLHEVEGEVGEADARFIKRIISVHLVQAALVLFSFFWESMPAQVCCGIALVLGFLSWPSSTPLSDLSREHLFERCGLLLVLIFGEALVGINSLAMEQHNGSSWGTFTAIAITFVYFLLTVGLFLMYLVQANRRTDISRIRSGSRYMALTAWLGFCLFNITAGFEMMLDGKTLGPVDAERAILIWLVVYMLSFFLFAPFNRTDIRPRPRRVVARVIFCFFPLLSELLSYFVYSIVYAAESSDEIPMMLIALAVAALSLVIYALLVIFVVILDYRTCVPREKREKKREKKERENPCA